MKNLKTFVVNGNPSQTDCGNAIAYSTGINCTIFISQDGSYGYCFSGIGEGGLYWEDDDIDGFDTQDEAEKAARKAAKNY